VKNAEAYYRSMFLDEVSWWNLHGRHMAETLEELIAHLGRQGGRAKVVVRAHNSHLGDARATEMGQRGELNVGQLVRQRYGGDAVLVGFTTHHGTVTAASE
jgi:erythromycin esterase-like protein